MKTTKITKSQLNKIVLESVNRILTESGGKGKLKNPNNNIEELFEECLTYLFDELGYKKDKKGISKPYAMDDAAAFFESYYPYEIPNQQTIQKLGFKIFNYFK